MRTKLLRSTPVVGGMWSSRTLRLIFLLSMLSACSASYHIKQAKKKAPELFQVRVDTVRDTIRITVPKVDTVFSYRFDTVEMWLDKTFVKYHYDTVRNDVFIEVDCPDDSVVVETIHEVKEVPYLVKPTLWDFVKLLAKYWVWWLLVIAAVLVRIFWSVIRAYIGL